MWFIRLPYHRYSLKVFGFRTAFLALGVRIRFRIQKRERVQYSAMEAKVSQQEPQPVWPQEGAQTPSFETPTQAAAFVAEVCGVTFDKIDFKPGDPSNPFDRASAWFP